MAETHTFTREIDIDGYEVEVTVEFDYTPAIAPCLEYSRGAAEEIEITDIKAAKDGDMLGLVCLMGEEKIESWIEDWISEQDEY